MTVGFDDFYRDHRVDAVRWAAALVGRLDVAEELAQGALIRTGERLDTLIEPAAYLRRAVVNACHSWHRSSSREGKRMRHFAQPEQVHVDTDLTAPSAEVIDALRGLPYLQRAAVVLRFWADWSDDDIADSLGCKPASVRVLVHRGLAHLREELTT